MTRHDWRESLTSAAERALEPKPPERGPLTAGQHVLHLLLTVLTFGLWSPVWFIRAWRGNPTARGDSRRANSKPQN